MPEIANLQVVVGADTSAAERGLDSLGQKVGGVGSAIQSALGAAAVGAVAGLGAAFVGSVKSAADFEKQMSAVGAVAGASQAEMEQLTKAALQLGKDTSFSATEAAQGLEELVKAGVSVEDILGGGAKAALDLAAAGAVSVADAAEIASNAMNVFGLAGSDMAHVADLIAGAANASAISVTDYKFSLSAAGAVAATVGISFESLTEAIAIMGNAGIKGSDAGTSLKTMMMNLVPATNKASDMMRELGIITGDANPAMEELRQHLSKTEAGQKKLAQMMKSGLINSAEDLFKAVKKLNPEVLDGTQNFNEFAMMGGHLGNQFFDAEGKAKSFAEISEVLKNALHGMSEEQKIATLRVLFGSDAIRAAAIMAEAGAEGFEQMAEAMGKVTAAQVAEERLNNLWGSIEKLQGSLETAAIMLGGLFTPALKAMADATTEYVNQAIEIIEQLPDAWRTFVQAFEGGWEPSETLSPFINLVGQAGKALRENFGPAILAAGKFITGTLIPGLKAIIAPIAAFSAGFLGAVAAAGAVAAILGVVAGVLGFLLSPLGLVAVAVGALAAAWVTNFGGIQEKTAALWAYLQPILTQLVDWLTVKLGQALTWLSETGWPMLVEAATAAWGWVNDSLIPTLSALWDWLSPKLSAALTWISETGWPALVSAGEAVWTFVDGSLIPALSTLWDWLSPKLQEAVNWLTGTGWPALVAAGELVWGVITKLVEIAQALFLELEKRGYFEEISRFWGENAKTGGALDLVLRAIWKSFTDLLSIINTLLIGPAVKVLEWFANLDTKGVIVAGIMKSIADAIGLIGTVIGTQIKIVETFLGLLDRLSQVRLPSFSLPGGGGGGLTTTATPLSYQATTSGGFMNNAERLAFVRATAARFGHDPETVARAAMMEGAGPAGPVGDSGMSFGALQAYTGGGMGNTFQQLTGLDPRDPNNEKALLEWQISQLSQTGWTPYHGPTKAGGYTKFQGINTAGGMQKVMPGGDPSHWPVLIEEVIAVSDDWRVAMAEISHHGQMAYLDVSEAGREAGRELISMSTDDLGNVTTIYSRAGTAIGMVITNAAGEIINSWGEMGQGVLTQNEAIATSTHQTGTKMVSDVTNAAGITVERYREMNGEIVTIVTDQNGKVLSDFTLTADQIGVVTDGLGTRLIGTTTNTLGGITEIYREKNGEIITIVTDANGQVVQQYTDSGLQVLTVWGETSAAVVATATEMGLQVVGQSRIMGEGVITHTKNAMGEIVTIVTDGAGRVVKSFGTIVEGGKTLATGLDITRAALRDLTKDLNRVEDAAGDAARAIKDINSATKGGGKAPGLEKRAMGGPVDMGQTYLVGEEGPELFSPSSSGYIIPNHQMGGGSEIDYDRLAAKLGAVIAQTRPVNLIGTTSELRRYVKQELSQEAAENRALWGLR